MLRLLKYAKQFVLTRLAEIRFGQAPQEARLQCFGTKDGRWCCLKTLLNAESVVYSFGVGEDVSFDLGLIDEYGLCVHAFDPTPRSKEYVRDHVDTSRFIFHPFGIGAKSGNLTFVGPQNPLHVSLSTRRSTSKEAARHVLPVVSLRDIMSRLGHDIMWTF